ncbi:MAG TPA: class II aldolase/adducin family protein [Acidimicrobiales bacterium]|nr:class II aldolase/adducin family protein [Acidimicrobiales bacterium]
MSVETQATETGKGRLAAMRPEERELRVQLAACYRIFDMLGWTELIFNHISVRVPGPEEHLLINPFGLMYREVTASNLVKIDLDGNIVGHSDWPVNRAGIIIHTAIHANRPDVSAVMHTHTTAGSAVACLDGGLDRNNFYAAQVDGKVAYHEFEGITLEIGEQERLVASLGHQPLLILRNHGLLSCGRSIPEAFTWLWTLDRACQIQIATASAGPVRQISDEARQRSSQCMDRIMAPADAGSDVFDALWRQLDSCDTSYRG